jgi:hypothetical protein
MRLFLDPLKKNQQQALTSLTDVVDDRWRAKDL